MKGPFLQEMSPKPPTRCATRSPQSKASTASHMDFVVLTIPKSTRRSARWRAQILELFTVSSSHLGEQRCTEHDKPTLRHNSGRDTPPSCQEERATNVHVWHHPTYGMELRSYTLLFAQNRGSNKQVKRPASDDPELTHPNRACVTSLNRSKGFNTRDAKV